VNGKSIILVLLLIVALATGVLGAEVTPSPLYVGITAVPNPVISGSYVLYTYQARNAGTDSIVLDSMVDERYGDLSQGFGGRSPCRIPQILAPGSSYSCQTLIVVYGSPGDEISNTLTVRATVGSNVYVESRSAFVYIGSTTPAPQPKNHPPEIRDITPSSALEGQEVNFLVTVDDADADTLTYAWNLDGDDLGCSTNSCTYQFGDDGVYDLTVNVDDGTDADSQTIRVTVYNVDPVCDGITVELPDSGLNLPGIHTTTFSGRFTDPGWLDIHTVMWEFGDGETAEGGVSEMHSPYAGVGTAVAEHAYSAPGDYLVRLLIDDGDGGTAVSTVSVHIDSDYEALQKLSAYIQSIDSASFGENANKRKDTLENKFSALEKMIVRKDYTGFIHSLQNDVRAKADGQINGNPENDWISGYDTQNHICSMIDDLVSYLETL
jgi:hypothetical protein